MTIVSFREKLLDFRSCWIVFIHVVQGRPGGLPLSSTGEAVKIFLASVLCGIHAVWLNREKHHAWTISHLCNIVRASRISQVMPNPSTSILRDQSSRFLPSGAGVHPSAEATLGVSWHIPV